MDEVAQILEKGGWQVVRQKGSHRRLENLDRPANPLTIAAHAGRDLPRGTLAKILRQAGLSRDEFEALRRR